jgi:cysteine-rich repeat protein
VWAGDTIESASGGWGPIRIAARFSPTQLILDAPVPAGSNLDYVVRRDSIFMETISIHADGDPTIVNQCSDPATSRWQGGSNGDPLWSVPDGSSCRVSLRAQGGTYPPIDDDVLLAHWTRDRGAGSLLSFFEPWTGTQFGAFSDLAFTDISYTQLGKVGYRQYAPHHRHFLAHMGSSAGVVLPRIKSVADAQPYSDDYRVPFAESLVGSLQTGSEIATAGFNPGTGTYGIIAASAVSCAAPPGRSCSEAVLRLDSGRGTGAAQEYRAPAVLVQNLFVDDADLVVEMSDDSGASFHALASGLFNLSSQTDEAQVGAGRRVFQYLGVIPATATGGARVAFRFHGVTRLVPCGNGSIEAGEECDDGNVVDGDGCSSACQSEWVAGGGARKTDCMQAWVLTPAPARGVDGRRKNRLSCKDGDASCDFGVAADGACDFRVRLCLNVTDTNLAQCVATSVASIALTKPSEEKPRNSIDLGNRDAIESALQSIGGVVGGTCRRPVVGAFCAVSSDCDSQPGSGDGVCAGRHVVFQPALAGSDVCSVPILIRVPLRQTAGGLRSASKQLSLRATAASSMSVPRPASDRDGLRLTCTP